MTTDAARWSDLNARVITSIIIAALGIAAIWSHGWPLLALVSVAAALMTSELFLMIARNRHIYAGVVAVLAAGAVWFSGRNSFEIAIALLGAVAVIGWVLAPAIWRVIFPLCVVAISIASSAVFTMRDTGFGFILWLILIVVATDIAGYFVGRALGGAKFWPAISPNKTWSGVIAGWIAAGAVGWIMAGIFDLPVSAANAVMISILLSIAAQMGDIAESAVKRRCGCQRCFDAFAWPWRRSGQI